MSKRLYVSTCTNVFSVAILCDLFSTFLRELAFLVKLFMIKMYRDGILQQGYFRLSWKPFLYGNHLFSRL